MLERRRHDRRRAFAAGTIDHDGWAGAMHCVVRDLSEGGALLLLDKPRRAPVEMTLALRGDIRAARVVWRGEAAVGVAFGAAPVRTSAAIVSLDAVRRERAGDGDRLTRRIARFVRRPRPT